MNYYMSNDIIRKHTGTWVQNLSLDAKKGEIYQLLNQLVPLADFHFVSPNEG